MDKQPSPVQAGSEPETLRPNVNRRQFLESGVWATTGVVGLALLGTGGRFVVGDALESKSAEWVNVGEVASLAANQVHKVTYTVRRKDAWRTIEEKGLLYVYSEDGATYTVLSAVCTHLGCNVHWEDDGNEFRCPCHDAHFDRHGAVVSGPPRRALPQLETKIEAGILMVLV
jgi:Rieske Fe-S protein